MMSWLSTRRPVLLWRGLRARRDDPDLVGLRGETDPDRFLWSVLPLAARSFAASIVALPRPQGRAAAVAYLYCRMLDTYEDMYPDDRKRAGELRRFAERFETRPPQRPTPMPAAAATDAQGLLHVLLIEKCELIDEVFLSLPRDQQAAIADLVGSMAEGMVWSADVFSRQGGVLIDQAQLRRYCHSVIGHPALFVLRLLEGREPTEWERQSTLEVSEMIQLANVSRDIERDLARGVAYHPALEPFLGGVGPAPQRSAAVRLAREEMIEMALSRVPAYVELYRASAARRSPAARGAAVMMLSFTDLHYRGCLRLAGHRQWRGPRGPVSVVLRSGPALVSARAAAVALARIESRFLAAASRLRRARSVSASG